jgi:hypothetical protein
MPQRPSGSFTPGRPGGAQLDFGDLPFACQGSARSFDGSVSAIIGDYDDPMIYAGPGERTQDTADATVDGRLLVLRWNDDADAPPCL